MKDVTNQNTVGCAIVSTVMFLSGCGESGHLTVDKVRNSIYDIPMVGKIMFRNGVYERKADDSRGQPYAHIGLVDLIIFGDLNGDGSEDAVTCVASKFAGPEIFLSLEVLLNRSGTPSHVASYLIGDRVGIDSVVIAGGQIDLHIITQGPDDPMCCPTHHVSRKLRIENGKVVEIPPD